MKVTMELRGLDGVLDTLQRLPAEVVSKRGGPVKAALRKGAIVILKQAQANLQASIDRQADGAERRTTGLLLANLIASRGKPPPDGKGEAYQVRVKKKTYQRRSGRASTTQTGRLLEYGSSKQPAEPWLRPAFEAKAEEAIRTIEREVVAGVDAAVAKLAATNKGK